LGHYGSGKTNLSVNYAIDLRARFDRVAIADLDVVNPYFRTTDSAELLARHKIKLIASSYANTNLEAPALPAGIFSLFDDESLYGVIDVGGDDAGALALGQYAEQIAASDAQILLVCKCYRPLSQTAAQVTQIRAEIEHAAHIRFTGFVNNSNLGIHTTVKDVINALPYAAQIEKNCALPLILTAVSNHLLPSLETIVPNLFGMEVVGLNNKWRI
jgi:hypothetical protein